MKFQITENSQYYIDNTAFQRRDEVNLKYLNNFAAGVSNIVLNQSINYDKLYCNLSDEMNCTDLVSNQAEWFSINKYQCD